MYYGEKKRFEPMVVVGLFFTVLLHAGSVGGIIWYRRAQAAAEAAVPPPSYVVARLIRKGVRKDPKKLPDKIVPQQSTQQQKGVDLTADASDAPNKPKKDKRELPISDKQRNALDKIDMLAQAQREIEGEGDPNGTPGGTASAGEGDAYMTRIADVWNRTWSLPAVIPQDEARQLYVLVIVRLDKDGNIQFPIEMRRGSGNSHFDSSITVAWQQIRQVPVPPPDRLASILAHGLRLKLTWRGMQ